MYGVNPVDTRRYTPYNSIDQIQMYVLSTIALIKAIGLSLTRTRILAACFCDLNNLRAEKSQPMLELELRGEIRPERSPSRLRR
jgi:hypothetical protein